MSTFLWILVLAAMILVTSLIQRSRFRRMPALSDEEFLDLIAKIASDDLSKKQLLAARDRVANLLSVDAQLLNPEDDIDLFVRRTDLFGDIRVGFGDLIEEVLLLRREAGEREDWDLATVGEVTVELVRLDPSLRLHTESR